MPYSRDALSPRGLGKRFSEMDLVGGNASNVNLSQVMKAVEEAENTIKHQLVENSQLRKELSQRTEELQKYKLAGENSSRAGADERNGNVSAKSTGMHQYMNESDVSRWVDNDSTLDSLGTMVLHQNDLQSSVDSQHCSDNRVNGFAKVCHSVQENSYNPGTSLFSPIRLQKGDLGAVANLSGQEQPQMPEISSSNSQLRQDLILKIREHEEEIFLLRRHLSDYAMKEAHIRDEKNVLERRIAQMRRAFDQQQQELVDAASKALSYRQDIIEENIHLTYALQSAQQEGSAFKSSLLALLSEYDFQPQSPDAPSIVSNVKILFRHLHENVIIAEERLKESQYQITPWHGEAPNNLNLAPQSTVPALVAVRNGLELVPQPPYAHAQSPTTSPFNAKSGTNSDALEHYQTVQVSSDIFYSKKDLESTSMNRISAVEGTHNVTVGTQEPRVENFNSEVKNTNLSYKDLPRTDGMEDSEEGAHPAGETALHLGGGGHPHVVSGLGDLLGPPYLPPVLEEPSSFSDAAEDEPLPAIADLQISGEAYPGKEIRACGYSINGTKNCNFEWVRHGEDGSVSYIEGAKQPTYLVTADDLDCYLAIQVQPLDERKRKGELVDTFANDHNKIQCDPEMQEEIERILSVGNASFDVSIAAGVGNIWEQAVLGVKTEGYSIKCTGPRGVVVTEKFSENVEIIISYEQPTEFYIETSGGNQHRLRSTYDAWNRDTVVLTMRIFKKRAIEKRSRRRPRFFK